MGRSKEDHLPTIGVTIGDAAGVGPEVALKAAAKLSQAVRNRLVLIGDRVHLEAVNLRLGIGARLVSFGERADHSVEIFDLANLPPSFATGVDAPETGRAAAENIVAAVRLWREGKIDAICTAPISKGAINLGGYAFPGHTEFLAELTATQEFRMSFFAGRLRVVLLSTHHALRDAINMVTCDRVADLVRFTDREVAKLLGRRPSVAVAGLNPHASEGGKFGSEEASAIEPAITKCRGEGINVSGPFAPDTVFIRGYNGEFDAIIALYHDQATIAVKALSFGTAVNVTLGLPLIRTSVDHGTAYDIAGKGIAEASSMAAAINLAGELARISRNRTQVC